MTKGVLEGLIVLLTEGLVVLEAEGMTIRCRHRMLPLMHFLVMEEVLVMENVEVLVRTSGGLWYRAGCLNSNRVRKGLWSRRNALDGDGGEEGPSAGEGGGGKGYPSARVGGRKEKVPLGEMISNLTNDVTNKDDMTIAVNGQWR
ncbi:Hypothetical predicted protein [Olea europaea subsp. europaea]|uniref:Uncharacterized protein n=1 Tax=Olea europaea subsp. europaea TaxID=158383 RepID=A0A8S0P798_OLEEU|nr:Hypothetical predicted protein [Olea europaea subsp. europaea]